jgi:putative transcriptional regulator
MADPRWFGGRLRELRTQAGLSQPQLAGKVGMNKDALARLERGERLPSWPTVLALAEALGVSCEAFTQHPAEQAPPGRGRPRKTPARRATGTGRGRRKRK